MVILSRKPEEQEQKFVNHMTSHEWWQNDINQIKQDTGKIIIGTDDIIKHHGNRLICPKCERGAFRHIKKDMAKCPTCGWFGKALTVDEYLTNKLYK